MSDPLQKQFTEYHERSLKEKIYVHTDKTFYTAGEIIWFKLYEVDEYFHKPLDLNKLAYVEIITKDQKSVLQGKIALKDGTGAGSLVIPSFINSGNYKLRAYTNWMKNFSEDFYFEKVITIVNASKKPDWQSFESLAKYDIQFFPEGGNLVYGLQSKVAFKMIDQYGRGVDGKGIIMNQNNDSITNFESFHSGMGHFLFTPLAENKYKAIIKLPGQGVITELPLAYSQGYVMNVSSLEHDRLMVTVYTTAEYNNTEVYLFAHSRDLARSVQKKEIKNAKAEFILDKKLLGDGISHLTIFNKARQPICERLYFKQPLKKLEIDVQTNLPEYPLRKKVNVQVLTKNEGGQATAADMSVSVYLIDSLQLLDQQDILTYLLLTSDLKGFIESPAYYLQNNNVNTDEATDNLMLTQGWRRFKWEDIGQYKTPSFEFLPEYEGHIITGKISDKSTGSPAKNILVFLSAPGERYKISNSISDENGMLRFIVNNFYAEGEIVVQANTSGENSYRIDISNPFSEKFSVTSPSFFDLPEKWKDQLLLHLIGTQVQNTFIPAHYQQFSFPWLADTTSFYGKPDNQYFLDDYTRFITMEEVIQEYVTEVRLRKNNGKFHYQVKNLPFQVYFDDDPLVLLDGVPIFDYDKLVAFNPLKIKKIEVVARKHYMGDLSNDGIISYSTYDGDLAGFELNPDAIVLEYPGLQLKREFYSPVYELNNETQNRLPDFRNVLYWSSEVKTDNQGKNQLSFYTSDLPGKYAVFVQGITADGVAGSGMIMFEVKK